MHRILLAAAAVAFSSIFALAADIPAPVYKAPPPVVAPVSFSWTGFYITGSVGYGWGNSGDIDPSASVGFVSAIPGSVPTTATMAAVVPGSLPISPRGFVAGGGFGYNYQVDRVVWGLEADFSAANIKGSQSGGASAIIPGFAPDAVTSMAMASQKLDFLGTVRGRLGITATDALLVYVTGGLAHGHASSSTT